MLKLKIVVFFPRYRIDDPEKMSTSECIENFNINFSKGGRFEKYASDMEYDENNPITEENIVNRASEIDYMLYQFKIAMSKNGMVTYDIEMLLGGRNDSKENKRYFIVNFCYCSCIYYKSDSLFS